MEFVIHEVPMSKPESAAKRRARVTARVLGELVVLALVALAAPVLTRLFSVDLAYRMLGQLATVDYASFATSDEVWQAMFTALSALPGTAAQPGPIAWMVYALMAGYFLLDFLRCFFADVLGSPLGAKAYRAQRVLMIVSAAAVIIALVMGLATRVVWHAVPLAMQDMSLASISVTLSLGIVMVLVPVLLAGCVITAIYSSRPCSAPRSLVMRAGRAGAFLTRLQAGKIGPSRWFVLIASVTLSGILWFVLVSLALTVLLAKVMIPIMLFFICIAAKDR